MKVYAFFYADRNDRVFCSMAQRKPDRFSSVREAVDCFRAVIAKYEYTDATGEIYLEDWRHDNGPDWVLSQGPRGGVVKERG